MAHIGDNDAPRIIALPKSRVPKHLGLWVFLAIVALGVVFGPRLLPMLKSGDRCHPEGLPTVKNVALTVCVDPSTWSWLETHQRTRQMYAEGPHKIYFDTLATPQYLPQAEFRDFILTYVKQYATNNEEVQILGEGQATLGGRSWQFIEFSSDTGVFVDYYYSEPKFGSAQLFFFSFKEFLDQRKALAEPILASVQFTNKPAASSS
jgi:hypothetical protein